MRQHLRRALAVAAGAVLMATFAVAVPATPAAAQQAPMLTVIYGSSDTNANQSKSVDLRCGGSFLGGGGYIQGPADQNAGLSQIAPGSRGGAVLDDPGAMRVSANSAPESTPADWTLHAYGICAYGVGGVEYQRNYVAAWQHGRTPLTSIAHCSPGKSLVGMGGQSFAIAEQVRLSTLAPASDAAIARVTPQPNPTASWAVQAIAVCANYDDAQVVSGHASSGHQDPKTATAECPAGHYVTAGGFGHAGEEGNLMQSMMLPLTDQYTNMTRADTRVATGSWSASTYAVCAPGTMM